MRKTMLRDNTLTNCIIPSYRRIKAIFTFALMTFLLCLFVGIGVSNGHSIGANLDNINTCGDESEDRFQLPESITATGLEEQGRLFHEQMTKKLASSDFCMQKIRSTYVSLAGILLRMAGVLFTYTCIAVLVFLTDRIRRFCQIHFIHLSDGEKLPQIIFIF